VRHHGVPVVRWKTCAVMNGNRSCFVAKRILTVSIACALSAGVLSAIETAKTTKKKKTAHTSGKTAAVKKTPAPRAATRRLRRPKPTWNQWSEPTYADSTIGDSVDGEDLRVRRAAVEALGPFNGSVVVADPSNGRILSIVNQKLALGSGFTPCSTIKVSVALAALEEGLIDRVTKVKLYGRMKMNLTDALAHSNNPYFARLGVQLGYDRVSYYARLFGYGEKAGLDIAGEQPGYFPPAPPKNGGMGMLTSFGEEISQTPLQLAALMTAIANGGKLYYLQYPRTQDDVENFQPRIKRQLDLQPFIPEVRPGMQGAVEFGTARRAKQDELIMGKTGTCSEGRTHLGWFGSFNEVGENKLVVVVLLTGGKPSIGPMASGVAGEVYRRLTQDNYFRASSAGAAPEDTQLSTRLAGSH
jgi:penicillin-binding protein 2